MKKRTIILIISAVSLVALATTGFALYKNGVIFPKTEQVEQKTTDTNATTAEVTTITYEGHEHMSALLLLQAAAKIETSGTGKDTFVTSINGVKEDKTKSKYWGFEVNGTAATVGAYDYITKDGDKITWKLGTF